MTTDELTPLARELETVLTAKADLEQRERDLKARIREAATGGPDSYAAGNLTVVVAPNTRFDPKKALQLIPEQARPLVTHTETVVDRDKVKALLPEVFEQAQTVGDYRISLKEATA